jgi:hypothetical protein
VPGLALARVCGGRRLGGRAAVCVAGGAGRGAGTAPCVCGGSHFFGGHFGTKMGVFGAFLAIFFFFRDGSAHTVFFFFFLSGWVGAHGFDFGVFYVFGGAYYANVSHHAYVWIRVVFPVILVLNGRFWCIFGDFFAFGMGLRTRI